VLLFVLANVDKWKHYKTCKLWIIFIFNILKLMDF
jgi:hypothetical protein